MMMAPDDAFHIHTVISAPVMIRVPGRRVVLRLKYEMIFGMLKIKSEVLPSCTQQKAFSGAEALNQTQSSHFAAERSTVALSA